MKHEVVGLRLDWIETASRVMFAPFDDPPLFNLSDLVLGLARECRFNGQIDPAHEFYSVAEHLTLLTRYAMRADPGLNPKMLRTLAMHDASEGLLGDIVRPIKRMCPDFCAMEERFERHLATHFDLIYPYPPAVKELDARMLKTERTQAMSASGHAWHEDHLEPLDIELEFWLPRRAAEEYGALLTELRVE